MSTTTSHDGGASYGLVLSGAVLASAMLRRRRQS
ncbi:MAG: MYXO-CTERM sorting domain-containing protein [Polyangiales bacterium]